MLARGAGKGKKTRGATGRTYGGGGGRYGRAGSGASAGGPGGGKELPKATWASRNSGGGEFDCAAAVCARSMRVGKVQTADDVLRRAGLTQRKVNNSEGLTGAQIKSMFRASGKKIGRRVANPSAVGDYLVSLEKGQHVVYGRRTAHGEFYVDDPQGRTIRYRGVALDGVPGSTGHRVLPDNR